MICGPNDLQKQDSPTLNGSLFMYNDCNPPATMMPFIDSDFGALLQQLEPTPIGGSRSKQQDADSSATLKETLRLLFQDDCDKTTIPSPFVSLTDSNIARQAAPPRQSNTTTALIKNEENTIQPAAVCDSPPSQAAGATAVMYTKNRFHVRHMDKWEAQFKLLQEFKQKHGHCRIPHSYPENQSLARWVKRQRHQYKQKLLGDASTTMTTRRSRALEELGFIWDSHIASWEQRMSDLIEYREKHGHCHVPTNYPENQQLAIWVKCQRRQFKLLIQGKPSTLTADRLKALNQVGFEWKASKRKIVDEKNNYTTVLTTTI